MSKDIKSLYQKVILAHNKSPYHYEKKGTDHLVLEAYNPLCGDKYKLYLEVQEGLIRNVYFHGYGCAISKASTSVLAQNLEGTSVEQALEICAHFIEVVTQGSPTEHEDFTAFAEAHQFPGRQQCATLSWEALKKHFS